MSYDGNGTFQVNSSGQPVVSGTVISDTVFNAFANDVAGGLSNVICRDGQSTISADIPMASHKFTGMAAGSASTDSATVGQTQSGAPVLIGSISGTNTITGSLSPAISAYASGQAFRFIPANANTGAATININALGAKTIQAGGDALIGGELAANTVVTIVYDGTYFQLQQTGYYAGRLAKVCRTMAQLRLTDKLKYQQTINTGYYAQGDGAIGEYYYDSTDTTTGALFTGSTSGTTLTVSAVTNGTIEVGHVLCRSDTGAPVAWISALGSGSGGTGTYTISASSSISSMTMMTDDGGSVIVAADGGRWKLNYDGLVNVSHFGVIGDGSNESYKWQAAFDSLPSACGVVEVNPPTGGSVHTFKGIVVTQSGVTLRGRGRLIDLYPVASGDTLFYVNGSDFTTKNVRTNTLGKGVCFHVRAAWANISDCNYLARTAGQGTFVLVDDYSAAGVNLPGNYQHWVCDNVVGTSTYYPSRMFVGTGNLTVASGGASFSIGETVTGGTSGATGILVGKAAGRLVFRDITGTFQNAEVVTGGTSGATATTSSTITYADINACAIVGNHAVCDNPVEIRNGGGNIIVAKPFQSATGTIGTPVGKAVSTNLNDQVAGYFERYVDIIYHYGTNAAPSGQIHNDACTNLISYASSAPGSAHLFDQDGVYGERLRNLAATVSVNANGATIPTIGRAISLTGNGANRTDCVLGVANVGSGQRLTIYGDTFSVQIIENANLSLGPLGAKVTIGQAALPAADGQQATCYELNLIYINGKWRYESHAAWQNGCCRTAVWSPAGNNETVSFESPIIYINSSSNTTGHLLPTATANGEEHTIFFTAGGANTTAFAAGSNVRWGSSGAPTFGSGAGNALSVTLQWDAYQSKWWVKSRVNYA